MCFGPGFKLPKDCSARSTILKRLQGTTTAHKERRVWFGVPASAGEAFEESDAPELRKRCRLKAGLRTSRFMESADGAPTSPARADLFLKTC